MIRIANLRKEFPAKDGTVRALADLTLEVAEKEFFVLLGSSGSGKSTLLRCVAGIETADEGEIWLGGRLVVSKRQGVFVRPEERGLGMVFQSYAVWPHMTVYQNVALPLIHGVRRIAREKVRARVMQALSLVQMETLADRPVPFLSGGQQQRVALARALATEPMILLMDEPLSNLDARLREEVRFQIREVTRSVGVTVLYVTHDQQEAVALADRVAVMSDGHILQIASPDAIYGGPANPQVADFLGRMNWLAGTVRERDRVETEVGILLANTGDLRGAVRVGLRPASIDLSPTPSGLPNELQGEVVHEIFLGEQVELRIKLRPGIMIDARLSARQHEPWTGKRIFSRCDAAEILLYQDEHRPPAD